MFKNMTQKFNSIKIYSIARYHLWGTFGIYPKADASTQNSSSVQDKQFQKVEEVPNNSEKTLVKNCTIDTAKIQ